MNILEFTILIWLGFLVAGFLGSLTGLGGGVVIMPLLARVAFSVFAFAMQRDRIYVTVTLAVMALLLYSIVSGGL